MARRVSGRLLRAEAEDGFRQGEDSEAKICLVCFKISKEVEWSRGVEAVAARGIEVEAGEVRGMDLVGPFGPQSGLGPSLE